MTKTYSNVHSTSFRKHFGLVADGDSYYMTCVSGQLCLLGGWIKFPNQLHCLQLDHFGYLAKIGTAYISRSFFFFVFFLSIRLVHKIFGIFWYTVEPWSTCFTLRVQIILKISRYEDKNMQNTSLTPDYLYEIRAIFVLYYTSYLSYYLSIWQGQIKKMSLSETFRKGRHTFFF